MTDPTDTPTDPPPDRLVAILSEQTSAVERVVDAAGEIARDVGCVERQINAAIAAFAEQHGNRGAAEISAVQARVKSQQTLDTILHEVRRIGTRQTEDEARIDALEIAVLRSPAARNGNGSGGHEDD